LQNFSRKYLIPIDKVGFDFSLIDKVHYTDLTMGPDEGCYIHGLFLEGARWDEGLSLLNHARPMELFCDLPLIHLKPAERSLLDKPQK
jgi:dynein heavy chain